MPRPVSVKVLADVAGYMMNMRRAGAATRDFVGELNRAAKGGKVEEITHATAGLGLGLVGVAGAAVKLSMDFEKAMSGVAAATHGSAGEIESLRKAALAAGKDTQFSATEAAKGIAELRKAGVSTADVLGGGLKGALDLAAAGQLSVAEAAETSASAMTQFKLSGDQVPHIADLLAAAAGKAQGSVHDMGAALNQAGLVASQFGISIEDTTGVLAEFASAGLVGSDAGTSFKTMLLAMANPSDITKGKMEDLNITFHDAQGKFIGLAGVAEMLQKRLGNLTEEQRNAALGQIFGNDAIRAASILYKDGAAGVEKWTKAVDDTGYASETAATLTDNLAGDLERLKGSLETVAIESGGGANDGLRRLAKGAESAVDAFGELPGWIQQTITVMAGLSGVGLLAGAGLLKAKGTAADLLSALSDIGPRGAAAAGGIQKVGSAAGKFGAIGIGVLGVYEGFKLFTNWAAERTAPTKANIDKLTDSIKEFAETGKITGELASKYGNSLQRIGQDVAAVTKGMKDLEAQRRLWAEGLSDPSLGENWNPVDPQVTQRVKDLDTALAGLVKSGGASQAAVFMRQLEAAGGMTADQFTTLTGMLPQYTSATKSANLANGGLAKGFGSAEANAKTLVNSLETATDAGQTLTDVWNQLHGALVGTDRAMLAANKAIAEVKQSFKDNGKAIEGNTTKALANRVAIGAAAKAAVDAAQAKFEETGSVKDANKVYDSYMGQLRKTLRQSGLTKKEVDTLIKAYGDLPPTAYTKVDVKGEEGVNRALDKLLVKQYALAKGLSPTAAAASVQKDLDRNRQRGYAGGGWTGPGSVHDEAGIVHADEFVIKADSRRKIEAQSPGTLDEMNATGQLPGYAGGGQVWPFPTTASKTRIPSWEEVASKVAADFGRWPSSPGAQRGDSGVWRRILAMVRASGIPYDFGNSYRPGDPKWHGSGRAIDFMGYNQDRLAQFFLSRQSQVLELIHRTNSRDYGITRGHYNAMPTQWPLHRNHLHIAMKHGGTIREPVMGVGASGRTYSFGENYMPERVTSNWQPSASGMGGTLSVVLENRGVIGSSYELESWLAKGIDNLRSRGRF